MAELMGLVAITSYFELTEAERSKWRNLFYEQILLQINPDGVHMELSHGYHTEVVDQICIGLSFITRAGYTVPETVNERLSKAFDFINHSYYLGRETSFGDDDNGHIIYPFFDKVYDKYRSLLQTGNHLFNSKYLSSKTVDFRNYLLYGEEAQPEAHAGHYRDTIFSESGYCILYDQDNETKVVFDVGALGDQVSAAHGHSDLLHFTIEVNGIPLLTDSGTFQYHSKDSEWRDYFRGVTAHNCVSIENYHHAQMNNRMSWIGNPKCEILDFKDGRHKSYCCARHDAYLKYGVRVSRSLEMDKKNKVLHILDELISQDEGRRRARSYFQLPPEAQVVAKEPKSITVRIKEYTFIMESEQFLNATVVEGQSNPIQGWNSSQFGQKTPSKTIIIECDVLGTKSWSTKIHY